MRTTKYRGEIINILKDSIFKLLTGNFSNSIFQTRRYIIGWCLCGNTNQMRIQKEVLALYQNILKLI